MALLEALSPVDHPRPTKRVGRLMASIGPVMRTSLVLLIILVAGVPLWAYAQNKPMAEREKIEALIRHIESLKDAVFIRNGKEYDAKAAGSFLRAKWRVNGAEVKNAKDFIAKVASVSSTTGKPYLIRFKDGREVKSGDYLLAELMKLEQTPRTLRGVLAGAYQSSPWHAELMGW